jgi:hypothetical protein
LVAWVTAAEGMRCCWCDEQCGAVALRDKEARWFCRAVCGMRTRTRSSGSMVGFIISISAMVFSLTPSACPPRCTRCGDRAEGRGSANQSCSVALCSLGR